MLINQTLNFVLLIVISLVSEFPTQTYGEKCWNGLGFCDFNCGDNDSKKIDYTCQETRACCVPSKVVIPIKDVDTVADETPGDHKCGLGHGNCNTKCLSPNSVYRGSANECPHREFCCIPNELAAPKGSAPDSPAPDSPASDAPTPDAQPMQPEASGGGNDKSKGPPGAQIMKPMPLPGLKKQKNVG